MHDDKGHGFFYPFVFPFYQKNWPKKTWWLAVLALIPILDLAFLNGWRLILIKKMSAGDEEILPDPDVGTFFLKGCVIWFMTFVYLIIPTLIIFGFGAGEIGNLFSALGCFWTSIFGNAQDQGLYMCLKTEANEMMLRIVIEIIWLLVAGTLFRVAVIRYAITNKKSVFLNLPFNTFLALRHIKAFIMMTIFKWIMLAAFTLVAMLMAMTVVLIPFIPLVLLLVYYYTTGYEYGHLGHDIAHKMKQQQPSIEKVEHQDAT
jgi:hypothetical protein